MDTWDTWAAGLLLGMAMTMAMVMEHEGTRNVCYLAVLPLLFIRSYTSYCYAIFPLKCSVSFWEQRSAFHLGAAY
ncbi:hypothetical protein F5Y04DRAFT_246967 [Hypomontagnella monticulosa]|nr:hypothetical protein F5Y04DRAFT_246967 [Hypomontagnella monticulosa]